MTSTRRSAPAAHWGDIATQFLRIGATAYGGPAIMGIMQAELQEKRGWVTKERFVEGLPVFDRVRTLVWTRAALRGIAPAVIGVLAVSLVRLSPHALPDLVAVAALIVTVVVLLVWRIATLKIMLLGAVLGIARGRLAPLSGGS